MARPLFSIGPYYWEDDPHFDLDNHVTRIALSPRSSLAALQDTVSDLMSVPLDFSRPLWHFHVIEKFGQGSAIIARLHHCMADGIALVHVLLSLTDPSPDAPWPTAQSQRKATLNSADQVKQALRRESEEILADPMHLLDWPRLGSEGALALARLILPGALRSYLQERGAPADGISIRAVVPVNLRPLDSEPDLGNRFGLVFLALPVGVPDPLDRLRELKRCMDELKNTPEPAVALGLLSVMGRAPAEIQDMVAEIFGAKATAVITNVPGPKEKLYLAGAPLDTLMFWVPQAGRLGLGVSILSYAGQVCLGVASDQGLIPDPEAMVAAFHREFDILSQAARRKLARRRKAVRPMAQALDRSSRSMDTLLEKKRPSTTGRPEKARAGCRAKTRAGRTCKNRPLPGSHYCRVHQKMD